MGLLFVIIGRILLRPTVSAAGHCLLYVTVGVTRVANWALRRESRLGEWTHCAILLLCTYAAGVGIAAATTDLSASANVGLDQDSNPLQRGNDEPPPVLTNGSSERDDIAKRAGVGITADVGVNQPTHFKVRGAYSRLDYDRIDTLDHSEYGVEGNLDWKPSQVFDVSLQASATRAPVGLADIEGQLSTQQTTRQAQGTLRLRPTPSWQLGIKPAWSESKTPLPGASDFQLRESGASASIDYLGVGPLIPGMLINKTKGRYSGIDGATRYEQQSAMLGLNYKVTDFSTFNLFGGYTHRNTYLVAYNNSPVIVPPEKAQSAFTGTLTYLRQLTIKSSISVSAFRNFQPYDAGVNTTVGTGLSVGAIWKATTKLTTSLDSQFVWSDISVAQINGQRRDLVRTFSLNSNYLLTHRLSLNAHATRTIRTSNLRSALFNETIAGLNLTATID